MFIWSILLVGVISHSFSEAQHPISSPSQQAPQLESSLSQQACPTQQSPPPTPQHSSPYISLSMEEEKPASIVASMSALNKSSMELAFISEEKSTAKYGV